MITRHIVLGALAIMLAAGCGGSGNISAPSTVPVSGIVKYKGKAAAGVKVTFHPKFDMGSVKFTPNGLTDSEGKFTLSTAAADDGAPPGEYVVTFELLRGGADKAGRDIEVDAWKGKFADPERSNRNVTIHSGENVLETFTLD